MGYLTSEEAATLLKTIGDQFAQEAEEQQFAGNEAAQRWDALFKHHAKELDIGYGVMDNPIGSALMGTYITDIQPFRTLRTQQIAAAPGMYADAQAAAEAAALAAAQAAAAAALAAAQAAAAAAKLAKDKQASEKAVEEAPRTVKKMQMYIKRYIKEIQEIQKQEKNSENSSEVSKAFWKAKIKYLETKSKQLSNPGSAVTQNILANVGLVKDFNGVDAVHQILVKDLNKFVQDFEEPEEGDPDGGIEIAAEEEDAKNITALTAKLAALKNKIADFFLLSENPFLVPVPEAPQLEVKIGDADLDENELKVPSVKASDSGAKFLFSKIAGNPKHELSSPNEVLEKSIHKDIEKIRELYTKEIKNLNFKEKDKNTLKKNVLEQLTTMKFTSDEIKALMKSYSAVELTEAVSHKIEVLVSDEHQTALEEKIARKFKAFSAPSSHQNLIKQVNQYIDKVQKDLSKLPAENINEKKGLENQLKHVNNLYLALTHNNPIMLQKNVKMIRSLHQQVGANEINKKSEIYHILDESLKVSDPYYDEIKKLDKYIENLEKDLLKNPQPEDLPENKSDRTRKLEIAKEVQVLALAPRIATGEEGKYGPVKEDNLTADKIKTAIANNTQNTKTLFGKGKLDGILNALLDKLEPSHKKKMKP